MPMFCHIVLPWPAVLPCLALPCPSYLDKNCNIIDYGSLINSTNYFAFLLVFSFQLGHSHSHINTPSLVGTDEQSPVSPTPDGSENLNDQLKNSNNRSSKKDTLVMMILIGDVIHSLNDGMAIGGAFSKSASDGLSTSLAVLFHEVPHVVGQYRTEYVTVSCLAL